MYIARPPKTGRTNTAYDKKKTLFGCDLYLVKYYNKMAFIYCAK
jgi:hypothetical protein